MYSACSKEEVLAELNVFLNDSIVLPPGEYGADHILPKTLQVCSVEYVDLCEPQGCNQ